MAGKNDSTKVVVRLLPPEITEAELTATIDQYLSNVTWKSFIAGKRVKDGPRPSKNARCYLQFSTGDQAEHFMKEYHGHPFVDDRGEKFLAVACYAPYQKIPRSKMQTDQRENSIEDDVIYKEFLEMLAGPKAIPESEDPRKAMRPATPGDTPLIRYMATKAKERRERLRKDRERRKKAWDSYDDEEGGGKGGKGGVAKYRCHECKSTKNLEEDPDSRGSFYCGHCWESWEVEQAPGGKKSKKKKKHAKEESYYGAAYEEESDKKSRKKKKKGGQYDYEEEEEDTTAKKGRRSKKRRQGWWRCLGGGLMGSCHEKRQRRLLEGLLE